MKLLNMVFEKNGFLNNKKEKATACIYLDTVRGAVIVSVYKNVKLEDAIKLKIDLLPNYVKTRGISEQTTVLKEIEKQLLGEKLNGFVSKEEPFYIDR